MAETDYIYKICPQDIWEEAEVKGVFTGAGIDIADGFIHCSTAAQTAQTANLFFKDVEGMVLAKINAKVLNVKWEAASPPGDNPALFPHIFGDIPMTAVEKVYPMPIGANGQHILPPEIPPLST
eukprot:m.124000 g.124000  ORF g.124000 m.124000 type:complete len:124 (+) comp14461_c1_seq2:431-802(+)